jgi:hypothetical protein
MMTEYPDTLARRFVTIGNVSEKTVLDYQFSTPRSGRVRRMLVSMVVAFALVVGLGWLYETGMGWYRGYRDTRAAEALTTKLASYRPTPDVLCWSNDPKDLVSQKGYTLGNGWISRDAPKELATAFGGNGDALFIRIGNFWDNSLKNATSRPIATRFSTSSRAVMGEVNLEAYLDQESSELIWLPRAVTDAKTVRLFTAMPYAPDARVFTMRIELDAKPQWLHIDFDQPPLNGRWLSDSSVPTTRPAR